MRIEDVVVNASPLISLFRSGQADLLPRIFRRIVVPEAVWQEVVLEDKDDALPGNYRRSPGRFAKA
jgi:predicted nucleic acid-binding protein